jgi:Patatin-like phospholipase
MNWSLVGRGLRLVFFLRVPLFTLFLLAALGPVSQLTPASSLLGNLFDQQNDTGAIWYNVFSVSFAAFLLAFTAITTLNLTLHYGALRFGDGTAVASGRVEFAQKRPGLTFILGTLAACVLIGTVIIRTGWQYIGLSASAALTAFASAVAMALLAKFVQLLLTDARVTPHPPPFLVFPAYRLPWLEKKLDDLYCWPAPNTRSEPAQYLRRMKAVFSNLAQWLFETVRGASPGYLNVVSTQDGERLRLRSGHVFALTLALLALATYIIVGVNKADISATPAAVPALAYVLLFLIVACWFLAALAFFFDRYRFPLGASLVALGSLTALVPQSDHYFRVETAESVKKLAMMPEFRTPADYLAERARDTQHRRLILIATPGGGIQAAAWTGEVLQKLDEMFPDVNQANGFRKSVALISSVSGGSLGSMIYAASFTGNVRQQCVAENAEASAIDEVAWGWTSPDFWRAVIPLFRRHLEIDRGWALEQKWAVINGLTPEPFCAVCRARERLGCVGVNSGVAADAAENDTFLSDWAARGAALPALIFNSMLVERGQHVVFSTTKFPVRNDPRGIINFYDLYPQVRKPFDVRVNTAARLSASFPYVAPASRPALGSPYAGDFHFVDGGYYDNLGVDSLIGWLTEAYQDHSSVLSDLPAVLIIQIRHFNPQAEAKGSRAGWGFQLVAPLVALMNMWNHAPVDRDRNELELYMRNAALSHRGPAIRVVTIPYCGLDYSQDADTQKALAACIAAAGGPAARTLKQATKMTAPPKMKRERSDCADPPLSWKLTKSQKACIEGTWEQFAAADPNGALQTIGEFLYGARESSEAAR